MYPGGVTTKPESKPVSIMFSWFGHNNLEFNGDFNGVAWITTDGGNLGLKEVQESNEILAMFLLDFTAVNLGAVLYYEPFAQYAVG